MLPLDKARQSSHVTLSNLSILSKMLNYFFKALKFQKAPVKPAFMLKWQRGRSYCMLRFAETVCFTYDYY